MVTGGEGVATATAAEADEWRDLPGSDSSLWRRLSTSTQAVVVVAVLAAAVLFGLRALVLGDLPSIGQLVPWPSPQLLLGHYLGGWQDAGWQHPVAAPARSASSAPSGSCC